MIKLEISDFFWWWVEDIGFFLDNRDGKWARDYGWGYSAEED